MKKYKLTSCKERNYSMFIIIFRIISLIIILIALFFLYKWHTENKENSSIIEDIQSQVSIPEVPDPIVYNENQEDIESNNLEKSDNLESSTNSEDLNNLNDSDSSKNSNTNENYLLDFSNLTSINEDTVAWITINNTKANFPVVKSKDNNFYLKHNFYKEYNSAGWIFADFRNKFDGTDKNIIIYGHNRRNGSMFSSLNNTIEEDWYKNPDNQYITLYTKENTYKYKIFSIYKIIASKFDNRVEFSNDAEYQEFLNNSLNNSINNFNVDVSTTDSVLTVYTCANNNQYRIIIQAKKITD